MSTAAGRVEAGLCPACGSVEVTANTWEAWCFDCGWRAEDPSAEYVGIRAVERERRARDVGRDAAYLAQIAALTEALQEEGLS